MADWSRLGESLSDAEHAITLTWAELERLVGSLPASAINHRAWWSGKRPHTLAWHAAGFRLSSVDPGRQVTFERVTTHHEQATPATVSHEEPKAATGTSVLLITCVKTKLERPAAAKDLYVSPLFRRARQYAEASRLPWFILSAEHGLVAPDEWLAPYERYLPDTPSSYREAWGSWVVERLALLAGPLAGRTIEVHASSAYVDAIKDRLAALGATVDDPLRGLTQGKRLAWYADAAPGEVMDPTVALFVAKLSLGTAAMSPDAFRMADRASLSRPGLYSWWADDQGAADLGAGLGHHLQPGMIYAGLAGATRWPSGKRSTNTLWSRIAGMHLGRRHEFSTFRRTLGSVLAAQHGVDDIDEAALTSWMNTHLRVLAVPHDDPDTLGRLESEVLKSLDPPLNLQGMESTPVRSQLTELRRAHSRK